MFTGIVEELGRLRGTAQGSDTEEGAKRLVIDCSLADELAIGDSVAVNGCCLTVVEMGPGWWAADAVGETLGRTNLDDLNPGDRVNLERPVRLADRLGGHMVQGHVDGTATVVQRAPDLRVSLPASLARYVVEKGSVTLDGVSLTVVEATAEHLCVAVIPHTAEVTTLGQRAIGDRVNIEVDVFAKYVERMMAPAEPETQLTPAGAGA